MVELVGEDFLTAKNAFNESSKYFKTPLQMFQYYDKYSRFNYDLGRRETWVETVDRAVGYLEKISENKLSPDVYDKIRTFILEMRVAPSMRLLAMAGPAADRQNACIYNCSYAPIDSIDSFVEELIIAMAGTGVGYSVERKYVNKLPAVMELTRAEMPVHVVEDSTEGWARAFKEGLTSWFNGIDISFSFEKIRESGTPLKIKGGRASGPKPLKRLLSKTREIILNRQGKKLRPIDAHDICCYIGEAIVSGGVRRCLPGHIKVHTQRGSVPIKKVKIGDQVMTESGYREVVDWVAQGEQNTVEILLENGKIFECTPDHRIAVLTDVFGGYKFKKAEELNKDDRLLFITHEIDGKKQDLLPLPPKRNADHSGSELKQPILSRETAWILGKFFADGYVQITDHDDRGKGGNTQVSFSCASHEIDQIEKIKNWMNDIGIKPQIIKTSGNWINVRSNNRQLARWIHQYKQPKTTLVIPKEIWLSTKEVRASFLAGVIDGDGCYANRPFTVASTIYSSFADQLMDLLSTLGIISEKRLLRKEKGNWKNIYVVSVKDDQSLQKIREYVATYRIPERKKRQNGYTIPKEFVIRDLKNKEYKHLWSREGDMNASSCSDITQKKHFIPVKVVSVASAKEQETYDISVAGQHVFVAEGYLVHNTALIALFDHDDEEMRNSKNGKNLIGNEQRWMANNSVVWFDVPSDKNVERQMREMVDGMRGEPGIFSRLNANRIKPERRKEAVFGTNPSLRKGTLVYTTQGIIPIEKLEGKKFYTRNLNGQKSEAECFLSGKDKPLYEVILANGQSYFTTKEHKWPIVNKKNNVLKLTTDALQPGMYLPVLKNNSLDFGIEGTYDEGFLAGWITGDGWMLTTQDDHEQVGLILAESDLHLKKKLEDQLIKIGCKSKFQKRQRGESIWYEINTQAKCLIDWCKKFGIEGKKIGLPKSIWTTASEDFRKGFIDGLFSSDGCVSDRLVLTSSHKKLVEEVQALLGFYGINGIIRSSRSVSSFPNGKDYKKTYQRHDLRINAQTNIAHFAQVFTLSHQKKNEKLQLVKANRVRGLLRIKEIRLTDLKEDVWDVSVYDNTHCFQLAYSMTGNCGEINLRPYEFCNLTTAIARPDDTLDSLREKIEVATIIGTIQSIATYFPGLRDIWRKNCEEERLLGVDINGWLDTPILRPSNPNLAENLRELRDRAVSVNREVAKILGTNQSVSVTCVKPSGNSSQLFDCSSGMHPRHYKYYVRNVRVQAESPLKTLLEKKGVPMDPENGQDIETANTFVIHFPVKSPDTAIVKDEMSAIEQCEYWKIIKLNWTEHNPSVTISYKEDEVEDLIQWVKDNKQFIGGMSFLPSDDAQYDQMPYEKISKKEYEKLSSEFPKIDFSLLYELEKEDYTSASQELACVSGVCDLGDYLAKKSASDSGLFHNL